MECKLHNIHKKFDEAFILWEQAYENYFNPQRFVANINAVIQAMRNITFTLQAEKTIIPNFDEWYKPWQDQMKADEALVWLNKSRTKIVHEKDFEIHSHSTVRIYDYGILYLADLRVPICLTNEAIAGFLLVNNRIHPSMVKRESILEIERAWIVPTYPKYDILVLLLGCFPFFHNLTMSAHKQAGIDIDTCNYVQAERHHKTHQRILHLIETIREPMKQKMSLRDLIPFEIKTITTKCTEEQIEKTKEHYRISDEDAKETKDLSEMEGFFKTAKTILKTDGYHQPMAFLFDAKGIPQPMGFEFKSRASKYIAMEKLAETIKDKKTTKVLLINESYLYSIKKNDATQKNIALDKIKNKQEVLSFDLVEKNKKPIIYHIIFERDTEGNVTTFHEPKEFSIEQATLNYLKPIFKVWEE